MTTVTDIRVAVDPRWAQAKRIRPRLGLGLSRLTTLTIFSILSDYPKGLSDAAAVRHIEQQFAQAH